MADGIELINVNDNNNQAYSDRWYFTFSAIRICSVQGYKLTYLHVVIATKPVHQLQIRPIVHNYRAPLAIPPSYIQVHAVVLECGEEQTYTQTHMTNTHFVSSTTHAKCNNNTNKCFITTKLQRDNKQHWFAATSDYDSHVIVNTVQRASYLCVFVCSYHYYYHCHYRRLPPRLTRHWRLGRCSLKSTQHLFINSLQMLLQGKVAISVKPENNIKPFIQNSGRSVHCSIYRHFFAKRTDWWQFTNVLKCPNMVLFTEMRTDKRYKYMILIHDTGSGTHTHNHSMVLFPGLPGWAGARRKLLLDFTVQGKITEADTPTIRLGAWTHLHHHPHTGSGKSA